MTYREELIEAYEARLKMKELQRKLYEMPPMTFQQQEEAFAEAARWLVMNEREWL